MTATGVSGERVIFSMGNECSRAAWHRGGSGEHFVVPPEQVNTAGEEVFFFSDDEESSYIETAEILSDESFMKDVREGIEQMKRGETISWEQVKKDLGL